MGCDLGQGLTASSTQTHVRRAIVSSVRSNRLAASFSLGNDMPAHKSPAI